MNADLNLKERETKRKERKSQEKHSHSQNNNDNIPETLIPSVNFKRNNRGGAIEPFLEASRDY